MDRLTAVIDEALGMYGEDTKGVILYHLELDYRVPPSDLEYYPDKIVDVLHDIFGEFAAEIEKDLAVFIAREFDIIYFGGGLEHLIRYISTENVNEGAPRFSGVT